MKIILFIGVIILSLISSAQLPHASKATALIESPYRPATITLYHVDGKSYIHESKIASTLIISVPQSGKYKIVFSAFGQQSHTIDSIYVGAEKLEVEIKMSGRCLYDYPVDYTPICPKQHKDNIIPIEYGLIVRAKKQGTEEAPKFHSGGCVISGCDPGYFCTIHKLEF